MKIADSEEEADEGPVVCERCDEKPATRRVEREQRSYDLKTGELQSEEDVETLLCFECDQQVACELN